MWNASCFSQFKGYLIQVYMDSLKINASSLSMVFRHLFSKKKKKKKKEKKKVFKRKKKKKKILEKKSFKKVKK